MFRQVSLSGIGSLVWWRST